MNFECPSDNIAVLLYLKHIIFWCLFFFKHLSISRGSVSGKKINFISYFASSYRHASFSTSRYVHSFIPNEIKFFDRMKIHRSTCVSGNTPPINIPLVRSSLSGIIDRVPTNRIFSIKYQQAE